MPPRLDPAADAPTQRISSPADTEDRRWWILGVLVLSLVVVMTANTSLNVAIPSIVRDTGATATELQWIVDAYALVFAGLLLTAGAMGDRFGRKGALLVGLAIFGTHVAAGHARRRSSRRSSPSAPSRASAPRCSCRARCRSWQPCSHPRSAPGPSPSGPVSPAPAPPSASWAAAGCSSTSGGARCSSSTCPSSPPRSSWSAYSCPPPATRGACRSTGSGRCCRSSPSAPCSSAIIEGPERGWADPLTVGGFAVAAAGLAAFVVVGAPSRPPDARPALLPRAGRSPSGRRRSR